MESEVASPRAKDCRSTGRGVQVQGVFIYILFFEHLVRLVLAKCLGTHNLPKSLDSALLVGARGAQTCCARR